MKPQFGSNSGLLCGVRINRWSHDTASIMTSVGKKSFSQSCFCERKSVSLFSVLSIGVLYWANGKQWANSRVLWTIGKQCVCDVCSDFLLTTAVYCNSHGRGGKRPVPGFRKNPTAVPARPRPRSRRTRRPRSPRHRGVKGHPRLPEAGTPRRTPSTWRSFQSASARGRFSVNPSPWRCD